MADPYIEALKRADDTAARRVTDALRRIDMALSGEPTNHNPHDMRDRYAYPLRLMPVRIRGND